MILSYGRVGLVVLNVQTVDRLRDAQYSVLVPQQTGDAFHVYSDVCDLPSLLSRASGLTLLVDGKSEGGPHRELAPPPLEREGVIRRLQRQAGDDDPEVGSAAARYRRLKGPAIVNYFGCLLK